MKIHAIFILSKITIPICSLPLTEINNCNPSSELITSDYSRDFSLAGAFLHLFKRRGSGRVSGNRGSKGSSSVAKGSSKGKDNNNDSPPPYSPTDPNSPPSYADSNLNSNNNNNNNGGNGNIGSSNSNTNVDSNSGGISPAVVAGGAVAAGYIAGSNSDHQNSNSGCSNSQHNNNNNNQTIHNTNSSTSTITISSKNDAVVKYPLYSNKKIIALAIAMSLLI